MKDSIIILYIQKNLKRLISRMKHIKIGGQLLTILITLFIIQSIVFFLTFSFLHQPYFDFDESNTIRISQQDVSSIYEILSYEQNFPFYYLILHFIFEIFGSNIIFTVLFNFAVWLITIFLFYKTICLFIENKNWRLLSTLLFMHTISITTYTYYVRMYGLIVFFSLLALYTFFKYAKTRQLNLVVMNGFAIIALSLLHPTALYILPIFGFISLFMFNNKLHKRISIFFQIFAFSSFLLHILQKEDFYRIYLGGGIEYFSLLQNNLLAVPAQTLFSTHTILRQELNIIFYAIYLFILHFFFTNKIFRQKLYLPLKIIHVIFFLLHIFYGSNMNPHHYIFFATPMLLIFCLTTYYTFMQRSKYPLVFVLLFFCIFGFLNITGLIHSERMYRRFCTLAFNLPKNNRIIITDHISYNALSHCSIQPLRKVYLLGNPTVIDTDKLSEKEILIEQAKVGGIYVFERRVPQSNKAGFRSLEQIIAKNLSLNADVFLIKSIGPVTHLYFDELQLFRKYQFRTFIPPAFFIFTPR